MADQTGKRVQRFHERLREAAERAEALRRQAVEAAAEFHNRLQGVALRRAAERLGRERRPNEGRRDDRSDH